MTGLTLRRYPLKRVFTCSTLRTAELAWKVVNYDNRNIYLKLR